MIFDWKTVVSFVAVVLTFAGYVPYLRDTFRGVTKPHAYSWFIWGLMALIVFGLQIGDSAGIGALTTLAASVVSLLIFVLSLKNSDKNITQTDTLFFALALIALFFWLVAKQPLISIVLISTTEMLGFAPTIRKSWNKPHTETLLSYQLNTFRHFISFFALQNYNIITWLYPITWTIANGLFALMLIVRRKQIS